MDMEPGNRHVRQLFCTTSNDRGLCPMATRGPLMPSWFGPNSAMFLGRALGLMNSSASWRPWMEGHGPLGRGWGSQRERDRERERHQAGVLGMRKMKVWGQLKITHQQSKWGRCSIRGGLGVQDGKVSKQQEEPVDTEYVGPCWMGWEGGKDWASGEQVMKYGS